MMTDLKLYTTSELQDKLTDYKIMLTAGREPDKDYIFNHYIQRIEMELAKRH